MKLNQVTVSVTDYEAAVDFYTRLGLTADRRRAAALRAVRDAFGRDLLDPYRG